MKYILRENKIIRVDALNFSNTNEFILWFTTLQISKRKPQSISSVEHDVMLSIESKIREYKSTTIPDNKKFLETVIYGMMKHLRLTKEEYETIYSNSEFSKIVNKGE